MESTVVSLPGTSRMRIAGFVLEGIGLLIMIMDRALGWGAEGFFIGQMFFNAGVMFHLGYLTARVK